MLYRIPASITNLRLYATHAQHLNMYQSIGLLVIMKQIFYMAIPQELSHNEVRYFLP